MTRALVLGGGGPLGVGWQAGLLSALTEASVPVGDADFVVGTSAGSIVGAQITSGRPLSDLVAAIGRRAPWRVGETAGSADLGEMLATLDPESALPEADWVATFDFLCDRDWPAPFHCTSFSITSGSFAVWDQASGVDLPRAVASSCTVPGLVSPVTINGESWIDGGARDALNADLAVGHEVVVAVSCMALEPPNGVTPDILAGLLPGIGQRIDALRVAGAAVEVIEPSEEFGELSGWGRYLMDVRRTGDAFEAGVRQGSAEVERIRALWTGTSLSASSGPLGESEAPDR
jgi:NTE family protein